MAGRTLRHSQNFLRRVSVVRKIIRLAHLTSRDLVIEIGPGRGIITKELARVCSQVTAVEYDRSLCRDLRTSLGGLGNVDVIYADFRHYRLPDREYKVFASIPFNITSDIMAKLTTGGRSPSDAYLIMQTEAARRFAGPPYDHESLRSLLLKPRFELSILHALRSTDFRPAPKANVVLLRIRKRCHPILTAGEERKYRDFLHFVFSEHGAEIAARLGGIFTRRQIRRLARDNGFPMSARIVELSFAQWLAVFRHYLAGVAWDKQKLVEGAEKRLLRGRPGLTKIHRSRSHPGWQGSAGEGRDQWQEASRHGVQAVSAPRRGGRRRG
jgi:23S rRNA (adenine-N6)-dimethyltransferase